MVNRITRVVKNIESGDKQLTGEIQECLGALIKGITKKVLQMENILDVEPLGLQLDQVKYFKTFIQSLAVIKQQEHFQMQEQATALAQIIFELCLTSLDLLKNN